MPGDQSSLTLDRWLRLKARPRQGACQPPCGFILMKVAWLELNEVHLAGLPDALQVPASEHRPLAQVRTEVVHEHPTVDVASLGGSAPQPDGFHLDAG